MLRQTSKPLDQSSGEGHAALRTANAELKRSRRVGDSVDSSTRRARASDSLDLGRPTGSGADISWDNVWAVIIGYPAHVPNAQRKGLSYCARWL